VPTSVEIGVDWDLTEDVKAWYGGQSPNYGTMIKAAKEEHVKDASSGFWSREYNVGQYEQWSPKLVVVVQGQEGSTYSTHLSVAGLPSWLRSTITVDGKAFGSISQGKEQELVFDLGSVHTIAVTGTVMESKDVKHVCESNETRVSGPGSLVFKYWPEYLVTVANVPADFFETSSSGWYPSGSLISFKRSGPDMVETGERSRLVFDGWYVNSEKLTGEPATILVDKAIVLQGRYRYEYYVNVSSPLSETAGSGWYAEDSVATFSVAETSASAPGLLGMLGVKERFIQWTGSDDFVGVKESAEARILVKKATTLVAVWEEDRSPLLSSMTVLLAFVLICVAAIAFRWRRKRTGKIKLKSEKPVPELKSLARGAWANDCLRRVHGFESVTAPLVCIFTSCNREHEYLFPS
jgi:hypothetical protein